MLELLVKGTCVKRLLVTTSLQSNWMLLATAHPATQRKKSGGKYK